MASNEDGEEIPPRGNEWEVVSLTASTYASAPGADEVDLDNDNKGGAVGDQASTYPAIFMSRHFVFPPSQHENLPLEQEKNEIQTEVGVDDGASEFTKTEEFVFGQKDQQDLNMEGSNVSNEFPGIPLFDENGNMISFSSADSEEETFLRGSSSLGYIDRSNITDESTIITETTESPDSNVDSVILNQQKPRDDKYRINLPRDAWWKRSAAFLLAHAKEANTFWSIFIAATVMGLVILGQQWQHERWQVIQLKWQSSIKDEKIGRMFGPIYRLKEIVVNAGDRRGSFIKGSSTSTQS